MNVLPLIVEGGCVRDMSAFYDYPLVRLTVALAHNSFYIISAILLLGLLIALVCRVRRKYGAKNKRYVLKDKKKNEHEQ